MITAAAGGNRSPSLDGVTGRHLDYGRPSPLRHGALGGRRDLVVFGRAGYERRRGEDQENSSVA